MNKITNTTPNLTEKNIDKIAELFPQVVTEKEGEDGVPTRSVDFDALRQALSDSLVEGADERYRLDWPGKRASLLKANMPIAKTLRPDRASSVEFDTTENVFIEGDNFEALKILQESYLGKVKMIYIDPPYNTGKDFVYGDNFTQDKAEYDEEIEAVDEEGNKMFHENTRTNPRFHSDWLSMMYERLTIARDLLKDDGVIFISIDDNEIHNLRKICDEIFGESNFIANFLWKKKGTSTNVQGAQVSPQTEYVLCFSKCQSEIINLRQTLPEDRSYPFKDEDGDFRKTVIEKKSTGAYDRASMKFEILGVKPREGKRWQIGEDKAKELESKNRFIVEDGVVKLKIYKHEDTISTSAQPTLLLEHGSTQVGQSEVDEVMGGSYFDTPKPTKLLRHLLSIASKPDSLILDFFSGSATTAHAVMAQNAEDGGNRKFIMVQLAEETPEGSEASKAGYRTIAELGRERIRRAASKIKTDYADKLAERESPLDTGFRAYTVADTAFLDVEKHPSELEQGRLLELANNIKNDRTPEDLLTQVMLGLGLTLDLPIETKQVGTNTVFYVAHNALVACFDEAIPTTLIDEMAKCQPLQVAFKDGSFGSDDALINAETHLKRLSPDTILSVI